MVRFIACAICQPEVFLRKDYVRMSMDLLVNAVDG